MWSSQLLQTLRRQTEAIRQVVDLVRQQREALKEGRLELLNDLLRSTDKAQREAAAAESLRKTSVQKLAAERDCEPTLDALVAQMPEVDAQDIQEAGTALRQVVSEAQDEMNTLSTLVEEYKALNEMMLGEWRRLGGGGMPPGLDMKG